MDYKTGVTKEGKILGRKIRLVLDGGAYCSWSETTLGKACILSAGPYNIENVYAEAFVVYTNKTMTGAMRGFGAPQVCFAYESHMDEIAEGLGIDRWTSGCSTHLRKVRSARPARSCRAWS